MNPQTPINQFQVLLKKAIDVREKALYPDNPLFDLPIDANVEAIIQREQTLLKNILSEYIKIFDVRNICEKCEKEDNCSQSKDNLGECEGFKEAC